MKSPVGETLRPVGLLENLYTARQVLGIYNSVIITATYTTPLTLTAEAIYSTLSSIIPPLIQRHPVLCCYFEGADTSKSVFKRLNKIVVADVLQIRDLRNPGALSDVLQELHDKRWSINFESLWKLVVLREPVESPEAGNFKIHIAFVYHHILGDGLSGTAFHKSLLGEMKNTEQAGLQTTDVPEVIDTPICINLVEPVEKLTSLPVGWLFLLQQLMKEYAPSWLTSASSPTWAGEPVQTLKTCPFRSRVRIVVIGEA